MPVYEYYCPTCKSAFEVLRSMSLAHDPANCPQCQTRSLRAISLFATFSRSATGEMVSLGGGGCACGGQCTCGA